MSEEETYIMLLEEAKKQRDEEIQRLNYKLQQKENIIKEVMNWVKTTIDIIEQQSTGNDEWILERLNGFLWILEEENRL